MDIQELSYARDETKPFRGLMNRHRKKIITGLILVGLFGGFEIGRKLILPANDYPGYNGPEATYGVVGNLTRNTPLYSLGIRIDCHFFTINETPSTIAGLVTAIVIGAAAGVVATRTTRRRFNPAPE